jgi:hypothetical protein
MRNPSWGRIASCRARDVTRPSVSPSTLPPGLKITDGGALARNPASVVVPRSRVHEAAPHGALLDLTSTSDARLKERSFAARARRRFAALGIGTECIASTGAVFFAIYAKSPVTNTESQAGFQARRRNATGRKRSKKCYVGATVGALMLGKFLINWCARRDSNSRPPGS